MTLWSPDVWDNIGAVSPDVWDNIGAVTLALMVVAYHVTAYMRGWFIPGRHHREIVAGYDLRLATADELNKSNAETMRTQAQTIAEKNAVELTSAHLLQSIRELADRKAGE